MVESAGRFDGFELIRR